MKEKVDFLPKESIYPFCFAPSGFNFTHWQKKRPNNVDASVPTGAFNDDAWVASPYFMVVCDGVSSIRALGHDGFKLPRELSLSLAHKFAKRTFKPEELRELIWTCARDSKEIGSTTCTVAVIDETKNRLYGLAYGDSSLLILRQTQNFRYKIVFESSSMSLSFNKPFQVNTRDRSDEEGWLLNLRNLLEACPLIDFQLEAGDIVIVASDGFADNVEPRLIERVVNMNLFGSASVTQGSPTNLGGTGSFNLTGTGGSTPRSKLVGRVGDEALPLPVPQLSMDVLSRALVKEALKLGCSRLWDEALDSKWSDNEFVPSGWPSKIDWSTSWTKEANHQHILKREYEDSSESRSTHRQVSRQRSTVKGDGDSNRNSTTQLNSTGGPSLGVPIRLQSHHSDQGRNSLMSQTDEPHGVGGKPDDISVVCSLVLPLHLTSRLAKASPLHKVLDVPSLDQMASGGGIVHYQGGSVKGKQGDLVMSHSLEGSPMSRILQTGLSTNFPSTMNLELEADSLEDGADESVDRPSNPAATLQLQPVGSVNTVGVTGRADDWNSSGEDLLVRGGKSPRSPFTRGPVMSPMIKLDAFSSPVDHLLSEETLTISNCWGAKLKDAPPSITIIKLGSPTAKNLIRALVNPDLASTLNGTGGTNILVPRIEYSHFDGRTIDILKVLAAATGASLPSPGPRATSPSAVARVDASASPSVWRRQSRKDANCRPSSSSSSSGPINAASANGCSLPSSSPVKGPKVASPELRSSPSTRLTKLSSLGGTSKAKCSGGIYAPSGDLDDLSGCTGTNLLGGTANLLGSPTGRPVKRLTSTNREQQQQKPQDVVALSNFKKLISRRSSPQPVTKK